MLEERKEYYIKLIKESNSLMDVCRKAGIVATTGNYDTLKKIISEKNIDISHFKRISNTKNTQRIDTEDYLNNKYPITAFKLKNRLLSEGYKECRCEKCGNTEWYGKPIPLELHHINGNNSDNRLENLQVLCPNCHAFTDNYGGKNQKLNIHKRYCVICGKELRSWQKKYCSVNCRRIDLNKDKPLKINKTKIIVEENDKKIPLIIESLKRTKAYTKTAKEFGVSDNAIKKLLHRRGYPKHIKELLKIIS